MHLGEYKQWRNTTIGGQVAFVSTTVLGFAPVLQTPALAKKVVEMLANDCRFFQVALHDFVVMPEHMHLFVKLPEDLTISKFMQSMKRRSAKELQPLVPARLRDMMAKDPEREERSFWNKSFRSVTVEGAEMIAQKFDYIHQNPVKRGLVLRPEDYLWGGCRYYLAGLWTDESGLDLDRLLAALALLSI
jgi:putative transposase